MERQGNYTQIAHKCMKALFVELTTFERQRKDYLDDDEYNAFQQLLLNDPEAGTVIANTGGLRKIRFGDPKRNKGKRGGIRVIYYYWHTGTQFWLFTVYDKDELDDLSNDQRKALKAALAREVNARTTP
jgi:hypothetical protein